MRKYILIFIIFATTLFAQYNSERSTEQSFENSQIFFNSTYINTFGLSSFEDVIPGFINDPLMDAHLNPANVPDLKGNDFLFYLDFTNDRENSDIIDYYPYPHMYFSDMSYAPTLDPRWLSNSRNEPSPLASLGLVTYPLGKKTSQFIVGATYQIIHKDDRFYSVPYWIYNYRPYYDSFSNEAISAEAKSNMPVIDRYSGNDNMTTDGHFLNVFMSYQITKSFSAGLGFNGVWHTREGSYLDQSQDEYGSFDRSEWSNRQFQSRDQEYSHTDFSLGVKYLLDEAASVGLKLGILSGTANQSYISENNYYYDYNDGLSNSDWSTNFSESQTIQDWKHDGDTKYLGFYFNRKITDGTVIKLFYRYTNSDISLSNSSSIADTSYYESHWISSYNGNESHYLSYSSTFDNRIGSGTKTINKHEVGFNFHWTLEDNIQLTSGIYYSNNTTDILTSEPVVAVRRSHSDNDYSYNSSHYTSNYRLSEDKELEWNYSSKLWTLQVPVIMQIQATERIGIFLGVNRKLETWRIKDQTTAYFNYRDVFDQQTNQWRCY